MSNKESGIYSKIYIVPTVDGHQLLLAADGDGITMLYGNNEPIHLAFSHTQFLAQVLNEFVRKARD